MVRSFRQIFDRHARWRGDLDAYVDGELGEQARVRFEAHLAACDTCAAEVEAARSLKVMLHSMPEHAPRRSLQLSREMVGERQPSAMAPRPPRAVQFAMNAAGAVAVVAVAAFGVVLAVDVSGGGDTRPADMDLMDTAPNGAEAADGSEPAPAERDASGDSMSGKATVTAEDAQPEPAGTPVVPPYDSGGAGAAGPEDPTIAPGDDGSAPSEQVPSTGGDDEAGGADDGADGTEEFRTTDEGAGQPVAQLQDEAGGDTDAISAMRVAQVGLVALAVVGAVTWALLRRRIA